MSKTIFYAKSASQNGIHGFLFYQTNGVNIISSQFIPREAFQDFVKESGINADQIKYV